MYVCAISELRIRVQRQKSFQENVSCFIFRFKKKKQNISVLFLLKCELSIKNCDRDHIFSIPFGSLLCKVSFIVKEEKNRDGGSCSNLPKYFFHRICIQLVDEARGVVKYRSWQRSAVTAHPNGKNWLSPCHTSARRDLYLFLQQ